MLNLHLLFANTRFWTKLLMNLSFDSQNGSRTKMSSCSLNSYSAIKKQSLFLLKYVMVFMITFPRNSSDKKFLVVRITTQLKSPPRCNPPRRGEGTYH